MANFQAIARTNYVHVEDVEGLKKALALWPIRFEAASGDKGMIAMFGDYGEGWPVSRTDENDDVIELNVASTIMPFVREGEVLIVMEAGHEIERYVAGGAHAWIRRGNEVKHIELFLSDIYARAAAEFGVPGNSISCAEY